MGRLVVASNRLPLAVRLEAGGWRTRHSPGGLVTALTSVLRRQGGVWVGWPGAIAGEEEVAALLAAESRKLGYDLEPVPLAEEERDRFYFGFSNEIIWPLFHDLTNLCNFDPAYWSTYEAVNRRFSEHVLGRVGPGDYVWVHDYHLMNVGAEMRRRGYGRPIGFFLHTPFPPSDIFVKLPWRQAILDSLLAYDLLGFQTPRDLRNFLQVARHLAPHLKQLGRGNPVHLRHDRRTLRAGAFPISIDARTFEERAHAPEVEERAARLATRLPGILPILGVDRLDYTKGLPEKLKAFRRALELHPALRQRVVLIQVVSPSRESIPRYHELKNELERMVGEINGEFGEEGWVPVHYHHRNLAGAEILALYRLARIALVTPLKDGMNLVAKEYCAARRDEDGVLILSEFAGAAAELSGGALLVNPYDVESVAAALHRATTLPLDERRRRMRLLRRGVARGDVFRWVESFLEAAEAPVPPAREATVPPELELGD